jgi:hypothetical protein
MKMIGCIVRIVDDTSKDQHALISTTRRRQWGTQRAPPITNVRTADVVVSVFFFGVITFVTVCTEVDAIQERSHAGNHIVVVVMIVQVDLLLGCGSMVNDSVEMLSHPDTKQR